MHAQTWLTHGVSLTGLQPRFVVVELTMAETNPAMAALKPLAAQSLADGRVAPYSVSFPVQSGSIVQVAITTRTLCLTVCGSNSMHAGGSSQAPTLRLLCLCELTFL